MTAGNAEGRDTLTCPLRFATPYPYTPLLRHRELAGCRCGRRLSGHIGEQLDLDTAILCASRSRRVRRHGLILADPDQVKLVRRNIVRGREVLHHAAGTTLAEVIVVSG